MESYFDIMAKHPNCLLAVDATDGGKWKSNFKTGYVMPTAPTGSGSFEETHGLLTKTNVEAENNYFKHTTDDVGYIETPLDLRGYAGDFTMISKAYIPSAGKAFTFFVQNNSSSRSSRFYYNGNSNIMVILLNNSSDVRRTHSSTALALDITIPHVFAVTVSKSEKNITFYIDGVKKNTTPLSSDFDYFSNTKGSGFSNVQIMQSSFANDGSFSYDFEGKLFASLFFNKELTADEIKILSDSMTDKKVEDTYDGLLCTTPTNLTSNTSDPDWECYTEPISTGTDVSSSTAYMAAAGYTGYQLNVADGRWAANKGDALVDTSAGVRFVWKRTDLAEWAVKRVIIGDCWKSVFPQRIQHFILQGSNDGTTWTNIGEKQTPTIAANVYGEQTFDYLSNTTKYKFWAINCNYDLTWTDAAYTQLSAAANKIQFTNEI